MIVQSRRSSVGCGGTRLAGLAQLTLELGLFCSAAQWIPANARVVVEEEAADMIMVDAKLCGIADDLVRRPVGDCLAAIAPQHRSSG